ncbi:hypothetical protein P154DRAFT_478587 [Amniculicola lignicola CBS 123094]|uniref:Uncharacterized protein n=1 Tax=Amniculicola lignicola CBS 123094 TaxID=1392246 RepID=A0A6A5VTF3_9PLEO|nr:hypothetical protein P154DRAFT_478587 [Amniculicola lignicola CBS 123094]
MPEPKAEEADNEGYEAIHYRTFKSVDYKRVMRWKGGTGRIATGTVSQNTNEDNTEGKELPAGQAVVVYNTEFKLSRV